MFGRSLASRCVQGLQTDIGKEERVNVGLSEVLTSAFPRRCFVGCVTFSNHLKVGHLHEAKKKKKKNVLRMFRVGLRGCKCRAVTPNKDNTRFNDNLCVQLPT